MQRNNDADSLPTIICAWCERIVARRGAKLSHGICLDCYPRETGVALVSWPPGPFAPPSPPYGTFRLDDQLEVTEYLCSASCNQCRPASGCPQPRNLAFFDEVLPPVSPFRVMRHWIESHLRHGHEAGRRFEYVLKRDGRRELLTFRFHVYPERGEVVVRFDALDEAGAEIRVPAPTFVPLHSLAS